MRAAASLGAPPRHAFRTVTLPLILPGVVSGALFAFVTSFDELVVVLFLASPQQRTLPRQIFSGVSENVSPTIVAAAVVLAVVSMVLMALMEWLRRRGERLRNGSNNDMSDKTTFIRGGTAIVFDGQRPQLPRGRRDRRHG